MKSLEMPSGPINSAFLNKLLIDLIEHFSEHNLANQNVEPDLAGQAYEYRSRSSLICRTRRQGVYTPRPVIRLMTLILQPHDAVTVYDPAVYWWYAVRGIQLCPHSWRGLPPALLYGQEKNLTTSSIARMNLILHGLEDFKIIRDDTLRRPAFYVGDKNQNI